MIAKPIIDPLFYVLTGTSVLCAVLIVVRASQTEYDQYRFLLWNLFLAWLPLVVSMFSLVLTRIAKGAFLAVGLLGCGVAWLLLYPNAPYLTTDFIHLIFSPSYGSSYEQSLLLWFDLVLFFLFSWCGLLLGYLSMRHFHSIVAHYIASWVGWGFILVVSFLGGFGVYLGRVGRFNSWDVLSPFSLIEGVIEGINARSAIFTALFGTLILIVYISLFILGRNQVHLTDDAKIGASDLGRSRTM
ncbi:putative membrane protein [Cohnella lupini]|uniref:Putative membrane protein n=2 Tax=Cohnella lupini TaxID=1294267 RepID=A0A3D9IJJ4_9BACL|nr:putative membrane protein [Cohnella lupini]